MMLHNKQPKSRWYPATFIFLIGWPQGHCFRLWFVWLCSRFWVELRLAPRVSLLGHSLTLVTGTREGRCKHWKPLRPQLKNGTSSFPLIIPLAKSNSVAIPKYPWDVGKVLYPFWGTAACSLEREKEWKIENSYLVYPTVGAHCLCLGHMAPTQGWSAMGRDSRKHKKLWGVLGGRSTECGTHGDVYLVLLFHQERDGSYQRWGRCGRLEPPTQESLPSDLQTHWQPSALWSRFLRASTLKF